MFRFYELWNLSAIIDNVECFGYNYGFLLAIYIISCIDKATNEKDTIY